MCVRSTAQGPGGRSGTVGTAHAPTSCDRAPAAEIGNQHPVTPSRDARRSPAAEPDDRRPAHGPDRRRHLHAPRQRRGALRRAPRRRPRRPRPRRARRWPRARRTGPRGTVTEVIEGQPMTVHRLPVVALVAARLAHVRAARGCRSTTRAGCSMRCKPDVVHIQSHIIIGRGLAREARKRGIPIIATNHVMAENILDFTTLPHAPERCRPQARVGRRQAHVRHDARGDHADAQGGRLPRGDDRHHTASSRSAAASTRANYTPDLHAARREPHPVRRAPHDREAHRRAAAGGREARSRRSTCTFDIVGGGDQRTQPRARSRTSSGSTIASPSTATPPTRSCARCTRRASLFAIASIAELQSIATMEAMASGLPIVAANAVALPHLVHDGENGYLFEPGNVDDLAAPPDRRAHRRRPRSGCACSRPRSTA